MNEQEKVGEMSAPTWMLEGIRNGEYSKIVYDDTEYVLLKHGHWTDRAKSILGLPTEACSECAEWSIGFDKNYCPNCGAKMDEVE